MIDPKASPPSSWYESPETEPICPMQGCYGGKIEVFDGTGYYEANCPHAFHRTDEWEAANRQDEADYRYDLARDR